MSIGEDYYKPIIVNSAFNNNYVIFESKRDEDKMLTVNEYLDMTRPYLVDMINDHKTKSEWQIQLTMAINFISSKPDSDDTPIILMALLLLAVTQMRLLKNFLNLFCKNIKKI